MKNFVDEGDIVEVELPYDVASGGGVLVGAQLFGVAVLGGLTGDTTRIKLTGTFDLVKKAEDAWNVGDGIYWNDTEKWCATSAPSSNLIGVAVRAEDAAAEVGRVRLSGCALGV